MIFNRNCNCPHEDIIQHVHEVEGYVKPAGSCNCRHTHCFETVTSKAIPCRGSHIHNVEFKTDINDCHCHKFYGRTGPAIPSGFGNHIHLIECYTSCNDRHKHCINIATKTEEPFDC